MTGDRSPAPGHPLDRPVWNALVSRQASLAQGEGRALRFAPVYGPFAAAADASAESQAALAALDSPDGKLWLVEPEPAPAPSGMVVQTLAACCQMTATALEPGKRALAATELTEAHAPAMLALALMTQPGPFSTRTHRLGAFIGVVLEGRLVAMAGERMRPEGFTEVSGVCTHPDYRGRGYGGALLREVADRILARGETPFLHAYASHVATINLYESLGFVRRCEVMLTILARA